LEAGSIIALRGAYYVLPFVVLPEALSAETVSAAQAINAHYAENVRERLPRRLVQA